MPCKENRRTAHIVRRSGVVQVVKLKDESHDRGMHTSGMTEILVKLPWLLMQLVSAAEQEYDQWN